MRILEFQKILNRTKIITQMEFTCGSDTASYYFRHGCKDRTDRGKIKNTGKYGLAVFLNLFKLNQTLPL